jgi:hypothetical protein
MNETYLLGECSRSQEYQATHRNEHEKESKLKIDMRFAYHVTNINAQEKRGNNHRDEYARERQLSR